MRFASSIVAAVLCGLALSGCTWGTRTVVAPPDKPRLDRPDSRSMEDCDWPLIIKIKTLSQEEAEALLGTNADRLIACYYKHRTLVKFIRTRDDGLSGRAQK